MLQGLSLLNGGSSGDVCGNGSGDRRGERLSSLWLDIAPLLPLQRKQESQGLRSQLHIV